MKKLETSGTYRMEDKPFVILCIALDSHAYVLKDLIMLWQA